MRDEGLSDCGKSPEFRLMADDNIDGDSPVPPIGDWPAEDAPIRPSHVTDEADVPGLGCLGNVA